MIEIVAWYQRLIYSVCDAAGTHVWSVDRWLMVNALQIVNPSANQMARSQDRNHTRRTFCPVKSITLLRNRGLLRVAQATGIWCCVCIWCTFLCRCEDVNQSQNDLFVIFGFSAQSNQGREIIWLMRFMLILLMIYLKQC